MTVRDCVLGIRKWLPVIGLGLYALVVLLMFAAWLREDQDPGVVIGRLEADGGFSVPLADGGWQYVPPDASSR
jgi:hypothetical protein